MKYIGYSGHRDIPHDKRQHVYNQALQSISYADKHDLTVKNGGAKGWDQIVLDACIELEVPYVLYLPFETSIQKLDNQHYYNAMDVSWKKQSWEGPKDNWIYKNRNNDIIDNVERVDLWWDMRTTGGTYDTYIKANKQRIKTVNWYVV